ncbi:hypothetical protein ACN47E_009123 [Coniothyrium glycines]
MSFFNSLFRHKSTTIIAGLNLTQSDAEFLIHLSTSLLHFLRQQASTINNIARKLHISYLATIQKRHRRISQILEELLLHIKPSKEPWTCEIIDVHASLQKKISCCNAARTKHGKHWHDAALEFWPMIAVSYARLAVILERLKGELQRASDKDAVGAASVAGTARPASSERAVAKYAKKVSFDAHVTVRNVWLADKDNAEHVWGFRDSATNLVGPAKNPSRKSLGRWFTLGGSRDRDDDSRGGQDEGGSESGLVDFEEIFKSGRPPFYSGFI